MTQPPPDTLVLYSKLAFYPVHWLALEELVYGYHVHAVVLAAPAPQLPSVHEAHGIARPDWSSDARIDVRHMPRGSRAARLAWLARQLHRVRPDVVWVQEEPIDPFGLAILAYYRLRQRPRIVTAVCENIFPPPPRVLERLARRLLWPRLDQLIAVADPSVDGIRAAGMPRSVPASSLVAGGLEPPRSVEPMPLPFERGEADFVVGFAGRLVEEKGWRVLAQAVESLPPEFKLVIAGDGPQASELRGLVASGAAGGRIRYVGLLAKHDLWSFYRALDCLAVPSQTTARWKEQSASTLVDGLAMGLPVVASASGGIPHVLGDAGILVPERDPGALAAALRRLRDDPALRERLGRVGKERFEAEFSIRAYAEKIAAALRLRPRPAG